jgi:choline-sulfatase
MRPNILLIMADQFRVDALSALGSYGATPNLDRLVREGWWFGGTYANSAECIPARLSLATGLYPYQTGIDHNRTCTLNPAYPNWMRAIADTGYRTSLFGKTHLHPHEGDLRDRAELMHAYGFEVVDETTGPWASAWTRSHMTDLWQSRGWWDAYKADMAEREANKRFVVRPTVLPLELYYDVYVGQKAASYLEKVDGDAPWFCWVSFGGPHEPWDTPEPYAHLHHPADAPLPLPRGIAAENARGLLKKRFGQTNYYSPEFEPGEVAALRASYAGNVTLIDEQIGNILATLSQRGLMDDTLVVFTSDHGEMNGDHGLIYKANFLEPTLHIPFIVKSPKAGGGEKTSTLVEQMDIGATLADYAGVTLAPEFRGRSVRPVIEGRTSVHRDYILSQFGGSSCVVSDRLKVEFAEDGEVCMAFDRLTDTGEQVDISGESSYQADIEAARWWLNHTISDGPVHPDAVIVG